MNQPQPGTWQWIPTPQPTRAFIRHWYEWILFIGDIAAFVLCVAILLTLSIQATGGWVW